ncbi:MAG: hypothetical protein J6A62_02485 [Oscillospiraceae bacterium]|nr:hypothetical protein [Oscillospiraceae bacterium]
MEDRCVCCGAVIPEGRMVCPGCEQAQTRKAEYAHTAEMSGEKPLKRQVGCSLRFFAKWLGRRNKTKTL